MNDGFCWILCTVGVDELHSSVDMFDAATQDEAGTLEARTWPPKGATDKWGGDDERF